MNSQSNGRRLRELAKIAFPGKVMINFWLRAENSRPILCHKCILKQRNEMNRVKIVVTGLAVAVCATAVATTSASAAPKNETTAAAFQEASAQPDNVVGDGRIEARSWAAIGRAVGAGVVGNLAYDGAKKVFGHAPRAQEKMFRRGGVPTQADTGAASMSRAFD
ncbi:hypothetical protein [Streptomyces sp. NPDC090131]|uniref:hypothetical protein n=1 Tax=Streptomyces sp. NPDC090131 TaxID=3365954 RepID=UPI003802BB28